MTFASPTLLPAAAPDRNRLRGVTILIAEDHPDSRDALREYLDDFGATCVESSSGGDALDAFRQRCPDVLLADVWMPDIDGLELIRRIRALPLERGRLTPAIAISAQVNDGQALMAGYHAVIPKPYDPASVAEMVEEFVRRGERRFIAILDRRIACAPNGRDDVRRSRRSA